MLTQPAGFAALYLGNRLHATLGGGSRPRDVSLIDEEGGRHAGRQAAKREHPLVER
jgi:hypothetical protein